jgi:hypothetical protein
MSPDLEFGTKFDYFIYTNAIKDTQMPRKHRKFYIGLQVLFYFHFILGNYVNLK